MAETKQALKFTRSKETKGTVVYTENVENEGDTATIPTVYIRKEAVTALGLGDEITITVEAA